MNAMLSLVSVLVLAAAPATPVVRATVYPDRAQVVRRGELPCGPRAMLRFENLPPSAEATSFRAATDTGTVEGLRVEAHPQLDAYSKPVVDAEKELHDLRQKQAALQDDRSRAEQEAAQSASYGEVTATLLSREMVEDKPNTNAWNGALDAQLDGQLRANQAVVKVDAQLRDVELKMASVNARLAQMQAAAARSTTTAEVLVSCPAGKTAQVELTYLVGGAGWQPAYEARADEGAGAVELTTFATVRQATGEPWNHAQLILSTAVPRQSATPPEIQPLRVGASEKSEERKVLVRRDEETKHAEVSTADATATTPAAGKPLRAADQGLSVQLSAPEPSDVPGDGTPSRVFVARNKLPAKFALRTAPKLAPFVFRVADLTNSAPFPLLAGPIDAFRGAGFLGRTALERVAVGAPFHVTFGIDEAVKVKRTVLQEIQRQTGVFGGNQRFSFAYQFEVANYQSGARHIELAEHVPVSELDDVKVELETKTTAGFDLQRDDGIVTWKLDLPAGSTKKVNLAFHVDVPSSYDTSGL
ncbi:MAG: mucoidy inhibitor MuiA family protein [Deltaproteobacteria bacterium]|nr:mucoidy inhibitor MuiA family protein [Deltaproteobacteria bacterium]